MDAFKTHGAFSWNELMTSDADAALAFYQPLFGWGSRAMDMAEGRYHVVTVGEAPVGGIMRAPPGAASMPPAWGSYITVSDVDAVVGRVPSLGGKVVAGPFDVPKVGRMAVLQDPQGAVINVMQYSD
jgi:predicted enzyme related to lactoylglutathione lyase